MKWLREAGHQGVVTFHFIPQHGKGFAPLGATFYYLVNSVLNVALWARTPMLQMWGVFCGVARAAHVADKVAALHLLSFVQSSGIAVEMGVVVAEHLGRVEQVNGQAARHALEQLGDATRFDGSNWCAAGGHDVERFVATKAASAPLIKAVM